VGDSGGASFLWDFDPAHMKARQAGALKAGWGGAEFSHSQPDILYGITRRSPVFQQFDLHSGKISTVHDPASCVRLNPSDFGAGFSVSADGNRIMAVMGPQQDKNYLVYIYDTKQGCRWYNTQSGEVGGQWGPKGTVSTPDRFGVHDARISKSGNVVQVGGGPHTLYWELDTLNVVPCASHCFGHHVMGYSHLINSAAGVHPLDLIVRPLNNLSAETRLVDPLPRIVGWYDYHVSWNYINPQDDTPACFSTYSPRNPAEPGAPLLVAGPWENEVDCVETDGKASRIWRFAHTYSTGRSFWSSPRGNVSQDGRFFMFTSDWEHALGPSPDPGHFRTDVFIVELR
jgi:hypothetical protein